MFGNTSPSPQTFEEFSESITSHVIRSLGIPAWLIEFRNPYPTYLPPNKVRQLWTQAIDFVALERVRRKAFDVEYYGGLIG